MRICLLSTGYPPASTEGIPRQRQVLAAELARRGHDVHVVTCAPQTAERNDGPVRVHEVHRAPLAFSREHPYLDPVLTASLALHERLADLHTQRAFDVVDTPFWSAPGFIPAHRHRGTLVVWLQTTSAQLLRIHGTPVTPTHRALLALERQALERAHGVLADSWDVLEAVKRDYAWTPAVPAGVAHLGLPAHPETPPARDPREGVEALVVGRLEERKGTALLLDVLPRLLDQHPRLSVRFVGADNSRADGWYDAHAATYAETFRRDHPSLTGRVSFDGYVSEDRLAAAYANADMLLAPCRYESFGLLYLEAMRAALPVITFAAGGAREVFAGHEEDGALLVPAGDATRFAEQVSRLAADADLRAQLGARALARFSASFTAEAMADATLAFYDQVVAATPAEPPRRPVFQVMESLEVGDAVSNITRRNAKLLAALGHSPRILAYYPPLEVEGETIPLHYALKEPDCGLIVHYWNYSRNAWFLPSVRGPKAIHFHNITPPDFYPRYSEMYYRVQRGWRQLSELADSFALVVGDSRFNLREFARHITSPRPALHIYPVIEKDDDQEPCDEEQLARLRGSGETNVLFVGRIARNKRQDRLIETIDWYHNNIDRRVHLWLVGDDQSDQEYSGALHQLRGSLPSRDKVTLTGKVSGARLAAFYRGADIFLCGSEHEGFCMPLAQAMVADVPVVAFAAAAVPETMGKAGVLIHRWDIPRVAELLHVVLTDDALRARILEGQRRNLIRFSEAEARGRIKAVADYLGTGRDSDLFETLTPQGMASVDGEAAREGGRRP